ncbi:MAG: peptidoglycan DD-metalloendopeptidase family protein [Bacteroidales bacterium]|nr:peptidoglycan DD-metalloendopeptidase family protein [Bacteroidales bacterium]
MKRNRKIRTAALWAMGILLAGMLSACGARPGNNDTDISQKDTILPLGFLTDTLEKESGRVKNGENFMGFLMRLGMSGRQAWELSQACPDSIFDVRRLRSGNSYDAYYLQQNADSAATGGASASHGPLQYIVYNNTRTECTVFKCFDTLRINKVFKDVSYEDASADVTINSSLWNDMQAAGAPTQLILDLSDIYAWTVDFFGLQKGDRFRVLYRKKLCEGELIGIDTIRYAIFSHRNQDYDCIMFNPAHFVGRLEQKPAKPLGSNIYWNEKGESMRKAFLKAPLHFSRISSGFSYARRHPVTREVKPHTGVDYAAPTGTPVMSIGDGTVTSVKYEGAGGNTVRIRHNSVYSTAYLHLSKYGKGISPGARVSQGQVIGYVGATGRCTGPHLDFRIWKNGSPINPLTMDSPPSEPLPEAFRPAFDSLRVSLREQLVGQTKNYLEK